MILREIPEEIKSKAVSYLGFIDKLVTDQDLVSYGKELDSLEKRISYSFMNRKILLLSLYHSLDNNPIHAKLSLTKQRFEFMGDAILDAVICEYLFFSYPNKSEGFLSKLKSKLVSKFSLAYIAKKIHLGEYIIISEDEEDNNGRQKASILADTFESLIFSVYLDSGFDTVRDFLYQQVISYADELYKLESLQNYKSVLQEIIQKDYKDTPIYEVIKEIGPDHNKLFTVRAYFKKKTLGIGRGSNKKEAEQMAAKEGLENIREIF